MGILNFVKPDKIVLQKATDFEAQFEFRPLEPGYGVTIGNALRRVLLNSLEGHAIVGISISGADHEFATIKPKLEAAQAPTPEQEQIQQAIDQLADEDPAALADVIQMWLKES